jgi:signal peptidase I
MAVETKTRGVSGWLQIIAIGRRPSRTLLRLGVLISLAMVAFVILRYVLLPIHIHGPSMEPTYHDGSFNFINTMAFRHGEPQRGDVVGIRFSSDVVMYVKRIVGLPGEKFHFADGNIYINGERLDEPYLRLPSKEWTTQEELLGPQEYYVVGDNRTMAFGDHEQGRAERNRIVGKIWLHGGS